MLWRKRRDKDLDEEIRAHLAMAARDRVQRGESPDAARHSARRELGNELLVKEVTRNMWGWSAFERLGQDVKYALRQIRRSPGFTAIAVFTLALGLGSTTAMFTLVQSILLRPLAYDQPERLVRLYESQLPQFARGSFSVPNLRDLQQQARSFSLIQAFNVGNRNFEDRGETERIAVAEVEARMFELLGGKAMIGRVFAPGEDRPEAPGAVILSENFWRSSYAGDPGALGRTITIDRQPYTIIGVMPESFRFPPGTSRAQLWTPLRPNPR